MYLFCLYLKFLLVSFAVGATTVDDINESATEPFDKYIRPSAIHDKTVSEIVNEQTETIKKIISAHRPTIETPIISDKESPSSGNEYEEPVRQQGESYEDFKAKCEYFYKMYLNKQREPEKNEETSKQSTSDSNYYYLHKKPLYIDGNIPYLYAASYGTQAVPFPVYAQNHFNPTPIVESPTTHSNVDTIKAGQTTQNKLYQYNPYDMHTNSFTYPVHQVTVSQQPQELENVKLPVENIKQQTMQVSGQFQSDLAHKYSVQNHDLNSIKVAPLTLQNTLVSDGKTMYYWYKSMPGYQIYVQTPQAIQTFPKLEEPVPESSQIYDYQSNVKYAFVTHPPKVIDTTPKPFSTTQGTTTTTTTTEIVPTFEVKYPNKELPREVFKHQLKFVYPVPYSGILNKDAWRANPYTYYSKLQPSMMSIPMSYGPTFHVIRTLDIPNKYVENKSTVKVSTINKK